MAKKDQKQMKSKKAVKILSALSQETRLAIFRLLIQESKDGLSAGTIAEILQVPAATLSFHLSHLSNAGLIKPSREGRVINYSIRYKTIKQLMDYLTKNAYKKRMKKQLLDTELESA